MRFLVLGGRAIPLVIGIATCVAMVTARCSAEAAESDDKKVRAGQLLNEGNALFDAGSFEAALAQYRAAYALYPSPKIFFNFAEAYRGQGQLAVAADYYGRLLHEAGLPSDSKLRQTAADHLREIEQELASAKTTLAPGSAGVALPNAIPTPAPDQASADASAEAVPAATVPVTRRSESIVGQWWFWTAIFAAAAVAVGAAVVVTSGGDGFRTSGELGASSLSDGWRRL